MAPAKVSRRIFTREFKLEVISSHFSNGKNINKTANKFEIDRKRIRNYIKDERNIPKQKRKSKAVRTGSVRFPLMEDQLNEEFLAMRRDGKRVKRWWFTTKAKQIFVGEKFALRRKTHAAQKSPAQLRTPVEGFHSKVPRQRKRGTYQLRDLGNMDQTPLPFVVDDNKTYEKQGADLPLVSLDWKNVSVYSPVNYFF